MTARNVIDAAESPPVPLQRDEGTGWVTAYASLYLASDEARFVAGVILPWMVDKQR